MSQIIALRAALRPHLGWHGTRLSFVSAFLIALFRVRTVNFAELATAFVGKAQSESHDKRMQRFFGEFEVDYRVIAHTVIALLNMPQPWVLSLDRTEWQFGRRTTSECCTSWIKGWHFRSCGRCSSIEATRIQLSALP